MMMDTGRNAAIVRLPRSLHARLIDLAARECRTVPEQLAYIVRDALDEEDRIREADERERSPTRSAETAGDAAA